MPWRWTQGAIKPGCHRRDCVEIGKYGDNCSNFLTGIRSVNTFLHGKWQTWLTKNEIMKKRTWRRSSNSVYLSLHRQPITACCGCEYQIVGFERFRENAICSPPLNLEGVRESFPPSDVYFCWSISVHLNWQLTFYNLGAQTFKDYTMATFLTSFLLCISATETLN